jgi:spermidine synthase
MSRRLLLLGCLVFSGLTALVYEVLWTRLLGFVFGTTTEAIGTVLAIFFAGMALGNLLAARRLVRVERPLRLYALLELGIGSFALASLPLLKHLDVLYAWFGAEPDAVATAALRIGGAALVILPPTIAMGATLPVVARGLVEKDATLGRWSALLYTANTLGAVLGAYGCGFWLLPGLGLTFTLIAAALVNMTVAGVVLALAGQVRAPAWVDEPPDTVREPDGPVQPSARGWFLFFFGVSGFVAIGYEIVWSKVFAIVMEGTLYGFSTVLSVYLLGIGLGSLAVAGVVDRIRDLPRTFGLLHVAIGFSVALGMLAVPYLPHLQHRLAAWSPGVNGLYALFLVVAPLILLPTALFGAAFPILIRIYTRRAAAVGEGMGVATAINTAGSILASFAIGFWWIPSLGIDASLYALLVLDLLVALLVLAGFQTSRGRERLAVTATAALIVLGVAGSFDGVRVDKAVAGRWIEATSLSEYDSRLQRVAAATSLMLEGRNSVVTVHAEPFGHKLQTNGLPEAGFSFVPPYTSLVTLLLGALPYLSAEQPERALVIGFGGGSTVDGLRRTAVRHIEVVELEREVVQAARLLYRGRPSPWDDPRVTLQINDGRNHLLRGRYKDGPRYDIIASQPSHPWLLGAANLFTEEFFELVRDNLTAGGAFALWVNGFRTDPESLLAVMTSFERIFPGSLVVAAGRSRPREALLLLGGRRPVRWRVEGIGRRLAEPKLAEAFSMHGIHGVEELLARCEGPTALFASLDPDAANTDDNAFLETRIPRRSDWSVLDFAPIEEQMPSSAALLPPLEGDVDVARIARSLLDFEAGSKDWPFLRKIERLLHVHGGELDPSLAAAWLEEAKLRAGDPQALQRLRALADTDPGRPEPLRALGRHLALRERKGCLRRRASLALGRCRAGFGLVRADPEAGSR